MDYAQITMDEYLGMKKDIHESIGKIVKNFVNIGKKLYQIDQSKAYQMDGYRTLAEFAKAEYDMKAGGVSRFVGVYKKYCDGDGLKQGYEDYTYAQLVEMLNIPEEDEALIRPYTPREDIRDLKRFNKEGKNDIHALESWKGPGTEDHRKYLKEMLVILFGRKDRKNDFDEICKGLQKGELSAEAFSEYVNPGGNKTIRNGRTMTFLFENEVRMKVWGEDRPAVFSYEDLKAVFQEQFQDVLGESAGWWKRQFVPEEKSPEPAGKAEGGTEKTEIAPAQKEGLPEPAEEPEKASDPEAGAPEPSAVEPDQAGEIQEQKEETPDSEEEEQIPGQDTILNHPEFLPSDYLTDAQVDGELVPAAIEPTLPQKKEECLSLISTIQGNVTLEKYGEAYQAAGRLLECLEVMAKC